MINLGNIEIADLRLGASQVKALCLGSEQVWGGEEPGPATGPWLCFTAEEANSTVHLDKNGSPNAISLETSTDGSTWTDYSWTDKTGDTLTLANVGDKVYMRAKTENQTIGGSSNYYKFVMTGKIAASGNIQTLLKVDGSRTNVPVWGYANMFNGCSSLTTAPELPATTLASNCYANMFNGCSSLTTAPELPATTLASYCYNSMFYDCSSLTSAPALPATTLASWCYYMMFFNCTSLTTAPELPATTLTDNCYYMMFYGCSSLTSAPELPATTLTNYCYQNMFTRCTSLSSVEVAFTTWTINTTNNWLASVAATGTFKCPLELSDIRDASHIPTEWQVENPLYIQNGLICWYDGIDNAGEGQHSSDTTTWKNLGSLGSTYDATRSAGTWQSNGAVFQEDNQSQRFDIKNSLMSSQMKGEWTYEIVFTPTANWFKNYNGLLGNHEGNSAAGIDGGQYENGNVYFSVIGRGITSNRVVCWQASQSYLNQYVGTLNTVACAASTTNGTAKTWHNGDLKNTVSSSSFTLGYTADFFIGAAFPAYDRIFDGVIHCLRIYNRPLTESEHLHNRAVDLQRFGSAQNA